MARETAAGKKEKKTGRMIGRPPKYTSKEEIEEKIEKYFKDCEGELLKNDKGEPMFDKWGNPIIIHQKPPTVTGLALALGFTSRMDLLRYQGKKEFCDTITRAKARVEEYTEQRLFDRDGTNGAQFSLRNNFKGWNDRQPSELDIEEQQARIEQTRAQTALLRAKIESDDETEIADDGFLEALNGTAAEDWADEEETDTGV